MKKYFEFLKTLDIPKRHSYIAMAPSGKLYVYRYKPVWPNVAVEHGGVCIGNYNDHKSINWTQTLIDIESIHAIGV